MLKKLSSIFVLSLAFLSPVVAFAATRQDFKGLIRQIIGYANDLIVLMMGIAVVMFIYYVIKYFIKADSERKEGAAYVMYALIGFFVILSMWGLVNILQNTFDIGNEDNKPTWETFTNIFPDGRSGGGTYRTSAPASNEWQPCGPNSVPGLTMC